MNADALVMGYACQRLPFCVPPLSYFVFRFAPKKISANGPHILHPTPRTHHSSSEPEYSSPIPLPPTPPAMSPPTRSLMSLTVFYVVCFLAKPASSFHGASMVARRGWREYHNARTSGNMRKSSGGGSAGTSSGTSSTSSSRSRSASKWEPARPKWWVARSPAALQGAPPSMAPGTITKGEFDHAQITDVLEHEYREALVGLAQKYSELIESIEGVDTVSVKELDG